MDAKTVNEQKCVSQIRFLPDLHGIPIKGFTFIGNGLIPSGYLDGAAMIAKQRAARSSHHHPLSLTKYLGCNCSYVYSDNINNDNVINNQMTLDVDMWASSTYSLTGSLKHQLVSKVTRTGAALERNFDLMVRFDGNGTCYSWSVLMQRTRTAINKSKYNIPIATDFQNDYNNFISDQGVRTLPGAIVSYLCYGSNDMVPAHVPFQVYVRT